MRFPRAFRKFLAGYLVIHLVAAGIFVLVLTGLVRNQMIRDAQARMDVMSLLLAEHIHELPGGLTDPSLLPHVQKIGRQSNMRFTIITDQGLVVADSITGDRDIGPHGTREEILAATVNETGFAERYSATMDREMMYLARRYQPAINGGPAGFVRVAIPAESITAAIAAIQGFVWLFAAGIGVLTLLLMAVLSANTMKPLNEFAEAARQIGAGHYDTELVLSDQENEWGELSNALNQMLEEITQREDRLRDNTQRLEAVLSSMIEGVVGLDAQGQVLLANNAACKMFSRSLSELQGQKLLDIVRIPELQQAIETTQSRRTFSKTEFETLTEPKRKLRARVSVLSGPVPGAASRLRPGVAVVLHDVTELRQLETMRQDFVANVSHELKTPLASIKAYAETLRLGALHDEEKNLKFVERIEREADMLNSQIMDLLELARVESGKAVFNLTEVEINIVCKNCQEQFATIAKEQQIQLQLDLTESHPVIHADPDAIATIVNNLVLNAIHYTGAGGKVTIQTEERDGSGLIHVIDTGIGIAPEQQARVFERFYRVDRARSRDKGGTGLGLAIVKHLSQSFGGGVTLQSQLGKGSRFTVRLPLIGSARRQT